MRRIILKEGPLVFLRNVLVMEIVATVFLYAISFLQNYEMLFRNWGLDKFVRYDIFLIVAFSAFQLIYVSLLFLDWYFAHFEITEKELTNGKCLEHHKEPHPVSEDAYFFKLSKYKNQIIKIIKQGLIIPENKASEIINRLEEEDLKDLCLTRANLDWGIDVPIDNKFKIYVWFDALINYITGSGKNEEFWPADIHVIGKGITWFHGVIWPAMLISA